MKHIILQGCLGILFLAGCKNGPDVKKDIGISTSLKQDTNICPTTEIVRDIPMKSNNDTFNYYKRKLKIEKKLGLPSLELGFDSLQIRIWYAYSFIDTLQVVILKNYKGLWTAEQINAIWAIDENRNFLDYFREIKFKTANPISGWEFFSGMLKKHQFYDLESQNKIPNYPGSTDGDIVVVEIATCEKYRIYSYKDPDIAQKKIWQAKHFEDILSLIEKEFEFSRIH